MIMKVLKTKHFLAGIELVEFVAQNNVLREDILAITQATAVGMNLFYYALA
jgi:hypothetical protein